MDVRSAVVELLSLHAYRRAEANIHDFATFSCECIKNEDA
jgi:hypothetical protein